MPSRPSEKNRDVVQAYLAYLQEMSRKISQRTGMENVLYGKTKASHHYYRAFGTQDAQYLRGVDNYLAKTSDRQLFLGNGLIVGCLQKKQTKKYIAAPLIYCLAKVEPDESGKSYEYIPDLDAASLNYDLITLLFEQDDLDEEDYDEFLDQSAGVDTKKLDILEEIETKLQTLIDREPGQVMTSSLGNEVFRTLKASISELSAVEPATERFALDGLQKKSMEAGLKFYDHQFFYVANLPGQLSTYTALRKLIAEVT
ncbi:MAG: hypothetical protein NZ772_02020 [Cyanobacteria bacterium]|nr:hypothetical protein [Cyanobacteriota bacterium]MDW8200274.1 hypothetical protein [Cyanobacteriota bacterium SKYGB_h_bin112]